MSIVRKSWFIALMLLLGVGALVNAGEKDKGSVLAELEKKLSKIHDEKIRRMPDNVREEVLKCPSPRELSKLSKATQLWLGDNCSLVDDDEALALFESLDEIKAGDDVYQVLSQTLWCRLRGRPLELREKVELIGLYWEERALPVVKYSPVGRGEISWIWVLEVKRRPHGVMHVGIDTKSRRFLCYERTIGVYYPEGRVLERIRSEIVQDPEMARMHIGRGFEGRQ